jgi:hypothetical protein
MNGCPEKFLKIGGTGVPPVRIKVMGRPATAAIRRSRPALWRLTYFGHPEPKAKGLLLY